MKSTMKKARRMYSPAPADDSTNLLFPKGLFQAPWLVDSSGVEMEQKWTMGEYVAGHLIHFGTTIQCGPGTTPFAAFRKTIQRFSEMKKSLDLVTLTTSVQIFLAGLEAQLSHKELFNGLSIVLTGGYVNTSILSLVGDYAVNGICTKTVRPNLVIMGAYGISFDEGL